MSKGENKMNRSLSLRVALALAGGLGSFGLQANPEGAQVVHGTASFSTPSPDVLNIRNSNGAIINWRSFDIAPGQTTNFIQPSADSTVLNRVIGNNPSRILGNLNSNGQVFLINQNGVLVGESATIDTAGFFGSTLNLTDADFLAGRLRFEGGGQGDFVNRGYIRAADGNIVLIAPNIENGGVIEVVDGEVLLAAGQSIALAGIDNPSIRFEVSAPDNEVVNLGQIIAERGAASLFAGTLKHSGRIRASGLVRNADGSISLVAQDRIEIDGEIDASGDTAGGRIDIRAQDILLGETGRIDASARVDGDGGEIVLFADDGVTVQGEILARGGELGGDGGFIETSGLQRLDIRRAADASAPAGEAGQWLIDPNNITIVYGGSTYSDTNVSVTGGDISSTADGAILTVETIRSALDAGTNVLVQTTDQPGSQEPGDIRVQTDIYTFFSGNVSLTLQAHNDIVFESSAGSMFFSGGYGATDTLTINLYADSDGDGQGRVLVNTQVYADTSTIWNPLDAANNPSVLYIDNGGRFVLDGALNGSVSVGANGMLAGSGQVNGDVDILGGAISGGEPSTAGVLSIQGNLNIDQGHIWVPIADDVQGGTPVLSNGLISATTVQLNSAVLQVLWDSALAAGDVASGNIVPQPLTVLSCTACSGLSPADIDRVIDPMMVDASSLAVDTSQPPVSSLSYEITGYDTAATSASFVSWIGQPGDNWNDANNWDSGVVPNATQYVFIAPIDGLATLVIDDAQAVAGMQLALELEIGAGGALTLGSHSTVAPGGAVSFGASDASLAGADVLYFAPGSNLLLNQGVIGMDLVSWGAIAIPAAANLQLDANLVQYGYLSLEQAGSRTLSGAGSLFNAGVMDFAQDATLQLSGSQLLRSHSGSAEFLGAGTLWLNGGTTFDLGVAPAAFSPDLRLVINGATLDNAQNLVMPDQLFWNSGAINGDLTVQAGQSLDLAGSGSMIFNGGTLTNNGTINFNSTGGNLFLNGQLVNNGLMSLNPSADVVIAGTGSIQQASGASMELIAGQEVTLGIDMSNAGDLSIDGGRILIDGTTLTQSGGNINIQGTFGELRVTNGGLLDVSGGAGFNTLITGSPEGALTAYAASTIDFNDVGIDLGLLQSFYLFSGSRLQGAGGTTLAAGYNRIQRSSDLAPSVITGSGTLTLVAGARLDIAGGLLSGVDANNLLLIDNAGTIEIPYLITNPDLYTFSLQFAELQFSGNGVLQGDGLVELLDSSRLVAGLTAGGSQNLTSTNLLLSSVSSELVANGLVYGGNLEWLAGRISGSGLTTTGNSVLVSTTDTVSELATSWTIAPGSSAEWWGDNDLLLDGGSIVNQGQLTIAIAATGDGDKALTRSGATETLRNEGLLLVNDMPGGVIEIRSGFDNVGGGIAIIAGTLRIDSDGDGLGDTLLLDQAGEFLQGFGTYDGTLNNQQGMVSPGRNNAQADIYQAGTLTVTGDYIQGADGLLRMDLDSTAQGLLADQLVVGGDLVAGGSLNFEIINNNSVAEIAALIDQSFQPFVIGGSFANRFDSIAIPDGLDFTLDFGTISISSDNPYLNLIADELQALIDNSDLTFTEVAEALRPAERRIRLIRSRLEEEEEKKRRRGGPRLVCR